MSEHYMSDYLTDDRKYIKKMKRSEPLQSKEMFYEVLQEWYNWNKGGEDRITQIGDVETGNTKVVHLYLNGNRYYLNGDTKISGVKEFLRNRDNPWKIIPNNRGRMNKVTNDEYDEGIKGFFFYKET
ncbi:hypothetical protein [Lentiprolixibacter aurantiacus]|uniref:Uncharacterized protein n=1 Tax=Lentiprolixibacter aurantiacus TaxID=2993939 RepID=A0AAE3SMX4_9FLAO|nr:hypothetical protein [Lentiprolixibacter aurantiacus]MCX2718920.1 hypothetical protein [Lentiprolixibacter aurantiacus]